MGANNLKAGIIGLGQIGGGIAVSLVNSGIIPTVYDIRQNAYKNFQGVPECVASPKDVAQSSDIIMICVVNSEQIHAVLNGENGILAGAHNGLIICIISTVSVNEIKKIQTECSVYGIEVLDCGVTPGNLAAKHGMVAMCGGNKEVFDKAVPILNGWAKDTVYCGILGAGMAVKIARNMITYGGWSIVKEAQHIVEAFGINPRLLLKTIEEADPQGKTLLSRLHLNDDNGKLPPETAEKIYPLMQKDLTAACEMANDVHVEIPIVAMARQNINNTLDVQNNLSENSRERGIQVADMVYGNGMGQRVAANDGLYNDYTLNEIFANIWSRPELSVHERRLLVMGVAAANGRSDLIEIQAYGALSNGEMTCTQLDELVLQLAYYAGWCNGGSIAKGVANAKKRFYDSK